MTGNKSTRSKKLRFIAVPLLICVVVVLLRLFVVFIYQLPQRNSSDSWLQRFRRMQKRGTPQKGALALIRLTSHDTQLFVPCYIVGVPGDTIRITKGRLFVNQRELSVSAADSSLYYNYILPIEEYWAVTYISNQKAHRDMVGTVQRQQIIGFSNNH